MHNALAALALLLAPLAAQQVFIVDKAGGPGTHYTEIQTAVLSVPSGSILLVRAGSYLAVAVNGKGMTILCDANVFAGPTTGGGGPPIPPGGFLFVGNVPAGASVTVVGLRHNGVSAESSPAITVTNCVGPVRLNECGSASASFNLSLSIDGCAQVQVEGLQTNSGSRVQNSKVVFEHCALQGADVSGGQVWTSSSGLFVENSSVQLVHTSVRGGNGVIAGSFSTGARPAVTMTNGELRALGLGNHELLAGDNPGVGPVTAIDGTGSARVDGSMQVVGSPQAAAGVTLTRPLMPSMTSDPAPVGGTLVARRYHADPAILLFLVALGVPGQVVSAPFLTDPVWVDMDVCWVEGSGVGATPGGFVLNRTVPNVPSLVGVMLMWQSVELDSGPQIQLSNPSFTWVR